MSRTDIRFANGAATNIGPLPHRDAAAAAAFSIGEFEIASIPSLPNIARHTPSSLRVDDFDDASFAGLRAFLVLARLVGHDGSPVSWNLPGPLTIGAALAADGLGPVDAFDQAGQIVRTKLERISEAVAHVLPNSDQLVVLDEPALAELMTPDFPIPPDVAVDVMSSAMATLADTATVGLHTTRLCDIATMLASGPDVISVPVTADIADYAGYLDRFLGDGGVIAWGVLPAGGPVGANSERYWRELSDVWCELVRRGCDPVALRRQALVTPGGGLDGHAVSIARRFARMTAEIAKRVRDQADATRFALGA